MTYLMVFGNRIFDGSKLLSSLSGRLTRNNEDIHVHSKLNVYCFNSKFKIFFYKDLFNEQISCLLPFIILLQSL